ncbi:MAG TPA: 5,10-methylene tetrahydromethanopterin reductase, partial [Elusimicrobia bacterium]|nr:5,10-methylene tetrahydromethanopterin reductase [Elusimicrobiota bacterium]
SPVTSHQIYPGCDTLYLNGFQGLTPFNFDCAQCGQCFLNYTGGICPLTSCAKSLLNGPCGGAKNGKCEVA